jgi:hypothetical protein
MHTFSPHVVTAYQLEDSRPSHIKSSSKLIPISYYYHMKAHTKNGDKASHIVDLTIQGWAGEVGGQLHALAAVSPVAALHIHWFGAGWPSQLVKVWQQGPKSLLLVGNQPQSSSP